MGTGILAPGRTSLRQLVWGFVLTHQTGSASPRTVEDYDQNLKRFLWYVDQVGWGDDIQGIGQWQLKEFLGYVGSASDRWAVGSRSSRKPASRMTVFHYYKILKTFFNCCVMEGFIPESPLSRVRISPPRPSVIPTFTKQDVESLLKVCDWDYSHGAKLLGSRNRAIILVFLDTGLRLSELATINLKDLHRDRGWIKVTGKGAKQRVVRIGAVAAKALWRYLVHRPDNGSIALWLSEEGSPLTPSGVQVIIQRLGQRANIRNVRCSPHTFRHTFAISYLRNGGNIYDLQYLLGHSSLEMVKRYLSALGMMDALRGHEKASPVDNLGLRG